MNPMWFIRMSRWVRNPPSLRRVLMIFAVVGVCIALVLVERFVGWPDWLTVNRLRP